MKFSLPFYVRSIITIFYASTAVDFIICVFGALLATMSVVQWKYSQTVQILKRLIHSLPMKQWLDYNSRINHSNFDPNGNESNTNNNITFSDAIIFETSLRQRLINST